MFRPFLVTLNIPGTMAANNTFRWTSPMDCTLQHLSLCQSNAGNGTCKVGTSADDDIFLTATAMGVSNTPVEVLAPDAFRYATTPRIKRGDIVIFTIDYDGAAGTPAADVSIVATFEEG